MRTDYFDDLVPGVPGSRNTTGDAANPHKHCVSPVSPVSPAKNREAEKNAVADAPCPTCGCGSFWRGDSGAWHCEQCTPPGDAHVRTWRNIAGGKVPSAPRPAEPWPADLNAMLRRVATAYEWLPADRADFIAWARRSPEGLADARQFLEAEAAKLPAPGLTDRRRVVLDMLRSDPALRVAWTCEDRGEDPVVLTLAIRGAGTVELAIPREKFDALALPQLIDQLSRDAGE